VVPTLIGRGGQLAVLREALARAEAGRGGLALVVGEAGIGKTSLVAPIAEEAEARGAEIVFGRAWEASESPPYFPLWGCFRSLGIERTAEPDPFRLWEKVLGALAERTATKPVVWVLDDLHAADLLTLDLLTFLAHPARAMRLLVVATARDHDPRTSSRASQRLARMARDGTEVRLGPLAREDVSALVARVLGRSPAELIDALVARTEGNPLFVVELARTIQTSVKGAATWQSLPPTVRALVLERVAPLPTETRAVLEAGAVLGRDFASGHVARLLHVLPAQVIDAVRVAVDVGIANETRPGHFAFTHIVVRDAIAEATSARRAAELHAEAEALLAGEGEGVEVIVERARHALASMADGAHAASLASRAARLLEAEGAFDRALAMHAHLEEARARGGVPPESVADKLHRAGLLQAAGRFAESDALCDALAADARNRDDSELLARAALTRGAELRPGIVVPGLVGILRASLAMPPADQGLVCRVRARLAAALQPAPDSRGPVTMAREAIAGARALGDPRLLMDVLNWAGAALVDYAPLDERVRLNQELFEAAVREDQPVLALRAQMRLALDRLELGELPGAMRTVERLRDLSSELGHPRHRCRPLLMTSMACIARGDALGSERALVEARELSGLTDDPAIGIALDAHAGQIARLMHRDDDMRRAAADLERVTATSPTSAGIMTLLVLAIHAQLEDDDELRRAGLDTEVGSRRLEEVAEGLESEPGLFAGVLAQAIARLGTRDACVRIRARLAASNKRHFVGGHIPMTYEGPVARLIALLDARLGDTAGALEKLRAAASEARSDGLLPWVAQIEYDQGQLLADSGRTDEAEALFESVERAAGEMGMTGLAVRAAARRRRAPATVSVAPRTRAGGSSASDVSFEMTCEGDTWRIAFADRISRIKGSRGMQLLGRLVERQGEEIHVLALGSDEPGKSFVEGPGHAVIDAKARAQYKARLAELTAELETAEDMSDAGRAAALRREKELLETELLAALGVGGKTRSSGSASERARVNVQRRLKDAIARIAEVDPAAGVYLDRAVRTGTYCRFGL
jgi:tetratricopeptide (TPR) repeat protein